MTGAAPAAYVVGTAGHIDHGKSTLVRALTGIDPDRLEEEKRRGMTIDLGFAYFDLPSGRHVGIVDVPGHQRFLKNMLAGVHGIDAVMFVVAADEGPMPQTREHLAIVDLLGVEHGVVVVTKADLVEPEWLQLVSDEIRQLLHPTRLRDKPLVAVSSTTGFGLDQLKTALDAELATATPRRDLGRPRLPVDRSFAMAGFGTVVTGTLVGGTLRVNDELAVMPKGRRVRVRGLQQHNQEVEEARPGNRTAANLVGLDRREVTRGDVLAPPGQLSATRRIDAQVTVLDGSDRIRHREHLLLYHGTAEVPVETILLDADELKPRSVGWVQLYAQAPLVAVAGDHFILRRPAPPATVAGGVIVDVSPRRHRRRDPQVLADLARRQTQDPVAALASELAKHPHGQRRGELLGAIGGDPAMDAAAFDQLTRAAGAIELGAFVLAGDAFQRLAGRVGSALAEYHAAHPLRPGMSREELKSKTGIPAALYVELLARLAADGMLVERGAAVSIPGHAPQLKQQEEARIAAALNELTTTGFAPPPLPELVRRHGLTPEQVQYLIATGQAVRVADDLAFSAQAYADAVASIRAHLASHQRITVAQARDLLQSSRKYVLPLLEWLDTQKITRRVGDDRILRT
jgi:selenocysteine-specific elongation factor